MMPLTEQRVLRAVTHRADTGALEVEWRDQVVREDGAIVSDIPFRRAYGAEQAAEFQADMGPAAAQYLAVAGWPLPAGS